MANSLVCITLNPSGYSTENPYYLTRPKSWTANAIATIYQESTTTDETYIRMHNDFSGGNVTFTYVDPFQQRFAKTQYIYNERMNYMTIDKPWFETRIFKTDGTEPRSGSYFLKFDRTPSSYAEADAIYESSSFHMNHQPGRNWYACPKINRTGYEWAYSIYLKDQTTNILHFLPLAMFGLFDFEDWCSFNIIGLPYRAVSFNTARAATLSQNDTTNDALSLTSADIFAGKGKRPGITANENAVEIVCQAE